MRRDTLDSLLRLAARDDRTIAIEINGGHGAEKRNRTTADIRAVISYLMERERVPPSHPFGDGPAAA